MSNSTRTGPTFVLYRILGNDMPPIHSPTQTLDNLEFILRHERPLEDCSKRFILNRIVDPERADKLRAALAAAGHPVDEIPFDPAVYRGLSDPQARGNYLTNNNPGRNLAMDLGASVADYVLPFDGQLFMPADAWQDIRARVSAVPDCPVWVVPMVRLLYNDEALRPGTLQREEVQGQSEPQIFFSRHCRDRFNEALPYGTGPKQEMLIRMSVPGPWHNRPGQLWDEMRSRPRSEHAGKALQAGLVYRLASGNPIATLQNKNRGVARKDSVLRFREMVDRVLDVPSQA